MLIFNLLCFSKTSETILHAFLKEGLLLKNISSEFDKLSPSKDLLNKSPQSVANNYLKIFNARMKSFPDHVKKDLEKLENGEAVESDNRYISKEFASLLVNVFKCVNGQKCKL
eukprot:NODE_195_length_13287_cov_0.482484.p12 type:complete len:113 gc:universal NODE_195_length_13287_cov_0.482484:10182-10520(+)